MHILSRQILICVALIFFVGCSTNHLASEASFSLLPKPVQMLRLPGEFHLRPDTSVTAPDELQDLAILVADEFGLVNTHTSSARDGAVNLRVDTTLSAEAYELEINPSRINIIGGDAAGLYYGIQTLRQCRGLTSPSKFPCLKITDKPRFAWRGLMLDCSRTFQSIDYLRRTIDRMSFYKMNVLHLHLTDDQGWRLEIKSHPELTAVGSKFSPQYLEPPERQGFYTQAEMKELIAYASLRGVTIVPEIEMPGHSTALLACHPELSCTGKVPLHIFPFGKGEAITQDICCAGNEATFRFFEEVLAEVINIFPSAYIHIGGDEAPKNRWQNCPKCQARMHAEGFNNANQLQSYFIRRIGKYINGKGRHIIGWSEILQGGLAPNAAVMDWIGGGREAAAAGHPIVMSPASHCYFDFSHGKINEKRVYSFDPLDGIPPAQSRFVLGIQACFWSHLARSPDLVDAQLFPRLLPLAERAWSPASTTDWADFQTRLQAHSLWLQFMDIKVHHATRP
jgi:hexosaminidase